VKGDLARKGEGFAIDKASGTVGLAGGRARADRVGDGPWMASAGGGAKGDLATMGCGAIKERMSKSKTVLFFINGI
jgi:hypothetical protein